MYHLSIISKYFWVSLISVKCFMLNSYRYNYVGGHEIPIILKSGHLKPNIKLKIETGEAFF